MSIRRIFAGLAAAVLMLSSSLPLAAAGGGAPATPNILFIFLDDFGWMDTGYMGSDFYETPPAETHSRHLHARPCDPHQQGKTVGPLPDSFCGSPPLDAKRELVANYQAKPAGKLHEHVAMATMIQAVDDGVGRIQETLEALHTGDSPISVLKLAPFRLTRISNS